MSSSRLPGKALSEIMKKPILSYMIERIKPSKLVDEWVIATSADSSDDAISAWCQKEQILCYRGSLHDVLDRYYQCVDSLNWKPETIVRLTADCPLHYHEVIDFVIREYQKKKCDYFTNSLPDNLEDGFDVEVFSYNALKRAWQRRKSNLEKEHVTWLMKNDPSFSVAFKKYRSDYHLKLSVDTSEDLNLISSIFENLYPQNPKFTIDDIVRFLGERVKVKR